MQHGIAVFAITNDPVGVLAAFAAHHGITYALLSDEWGRVTRALGMVDEEVVRHNQEAGIPAPPQPLDGVAYPGAFLLDGDGIVRDRRFPPDVLRRESSASILRDVFGVDSP